MLGRAFDRKESLNIAHDTMRHNICNFRISAYESNVMSNIRES